MSEAPPLRFENVTVAFDNVTALDEVSFTLPTGETRILFGEAGSGKTILLKAALGLVPIDAGRIFVFGEDISRLPEKRLFEVRSKIGMLFQESALFDSLTIEENVAYPLENQKSIVCDPAEKSRRVRDSLKFVDLPGTLTKFPSELSGGMRRRAAIARAVVTEPPLLLYDSPTAGLDPITAQTIITLIVKQRDVSNTTTMIVTHRYLNGHLLANYGYDRDTGAIEPQIAQGFPRRATTKFLGFRAGKLVFEGTQAQIEASDDAYVRKFVKFNG